MSSTPARHRAPRQAPRRRPRLLPTLGALALSIAAAGSWLTPQPTSTSAPQPDPVSAMWRDNAVEEPPLQRKPTASRGAPRERVNTRRLAAKLEQRRTRSLEDLQQRAERYERFLAANQWVLPLESYDITATFGEVSSYWSTSHTGLDFAAPSGAPIRALTSGTITETGYSGAYGERTILTAEDGTDFWFCHQNSITVDEGDSVQAGEIIGTVGSTGNVTGPHLHLEIRPDGGEPIDPTAALQGEGLSP